MDAASGLMHSLATTSANVGKMTQAHGLLDGGELNIYGDTGYQSVHKRNP
ncbi:hypothetical protein PS850_06194 [Pseudomonas fluorescens]|nr:hypothetical protein PS850_06194 [Pseudomonas fluorescens]